MQPQCAVQNVLEYAGSHLFLTSAPHLLCAPSLVPVSPLCKYQLQVCYLPAALNAKDSGQEIRDSNWPTYNLNKHKSV